MRSKLGSKALECNRSGIALESVQTDIGVIPILRVLEADRSRIDKLSIS